MARTVETIIEDDKDKASLGVDDDGMDDSGLVDDGSDKGPTPEETAADLRKQLESANARADRETTARKEAETRALTASNTAGNAVQHQIVAQETAIEGKITTAKTNLDSIKAQLKQAKAAQDGDAEVELQDALTNARYELNTAEGEKKNFAAWKENQSKVPVRTENAAPSSPYTTKEQAWIDSHPAFTKNKKFSRTAKIAAQEALDEGHKQDSPAYFQYIEDTLKENGLLGTVEEPLSGAGTTTASAAAPNRSGTGSGSAPVNKNSKYPHLPKGFTIPAEWVQAATDQGFDDVREYANMRLEEESKGQPR